MPLKDSEAPTIKNQTYHQSSDQQMPPYSFMTVAVTRFQDPCRTHQTFGGQSNCYRTNKTIKRTTTSNP